MITSEAEPYERLLNLTVPDTSRDTVEAWLSMPNANRLNAEPGSKVTVTMYDGEVQEVTAQNGETAPTSHTQRPALAAAGAVVALVTTLITDAHVTAAWAIPIMAAAYLLTATAVVLVRTREHATPSIRWHS